MHDDKSTSKIKLKPPVANDPDPEFTYKVYSVLSYFFVLVVIGIPMWWYTTRVYRAALPLSDMFDVDLPNKTLEDDTHLGVPLSLEYDVLITIVNPEPQNLYVDLDGRDLDAHLQPFLAQLAPIAQFTVKSQWLYLVELGAMPTKRLDHYALFERQLPHVITPLEKKLWLHLSPRPCLNLVLYVGQCGVPLYLYNDREERSTTNAFLSPRWGGIYIVNADRESCDKKYYKPDVAQIAATFVVQLKRLLHLDLDGGDLVALKRGRAEAMVDSTRRTLKSLAQLLSEISSIVISDDVAVRIQTALDNVRRAEELLRGSDDDGVVEALQVAKVAFNNSEAAFSDPSLLALLYFPEDQKYAVYIPLFLPVMIPVFMSLITLRKWYTNYKEGKLKVD